MAKLLTAVRASDAEAVHKLASIIYAGNKSKDDDDLPYVVALAKTGHDRAVTDLYERFEYFLLRFRSLLKAGKFDGHPMVRQFLALYVEVRADGTGRQLRSALMSRKNMHWRMMESAKDLIAMLREQFSLLDDDDLDAIIDVTFFQCLRVYDPKGKVRNELKKKGIDYDSLAKSTKTKYENMKDDTGRRLYPEIGFHGFMYNYFHYLLRKNLDKEIRGVMPGIGWCDLYTDHTLPDFENSSLDPEFFEQNSIDQEAYDSVDDQIDREISIDEDWVLGNTAQWPFTILTSQERWILKARYYDKLFACDISDRLGISTSAIRNRIRIAKEKLIEAAGEELQQKLNYDYKPSVEYVRKWYAENNKPLARLMGIDVEEYEDEE